MKFVATGLMLALAIAAGTEEKRMTDLVDLEVARWQVVNDGVMGGLSDGRVSVREGTMVFEGRVSLENNGGFASVRTQLAKVDTADREGISLRVEGGGDTYQLRLRTDKAWDGVAYQARFEAPDGEPAIVRVPFSAFRPTWRGRELEDVPPLDPAQVEQLGFLIADKQAGPFRLVVSAIELYGREGGSGT